MKLVTIAEMQAAERESGVPESQLMENAGQACADAIGRVFGGVSGKRVLVLVGPGNNGGDGLVAARHLDEWGARVQVYLLKPRPLDDEVFRAVEERRLTVIPAEIDAEASFGGLESALGAIDLVVDALLGTGASRPIEGLLAEVLRRLAIVRERANPPALVAVDLPSGVNPDTGVVDPATVPADLTVTFQWAKAGLVMLPASQFTGRLEVVDIGIPDDWDRRIKTELMTVAWARALLPERPAGAHKGTFGRAVVIAGSERYVGAAHLATIAALRSGAGLATLACGRSIYPLLAARLVEPTFFPLSDEGGHLTGRSAGELTELLDQGIESLLVGPGLGANDSVRDFIATLLKQAAEHKLPALIIDADGLNNLAAQPEWPSLIGVPAVLTPHPGEMSRLSGLSIAEIEANRLAVTRRFAAEWGCVVVLKGANTVVAGPDDRALVSPFANPALASGGTGDVLAGTIAGLAAQGIDVFEASGLGVYLHGLAGDRVREAIGDAGLLAGDLLPELPLAIKQLRELPA